MACFHIPDRHNMVTLELRQLPPFPHDEPTESLHSLVYHIKGILENFGQGHPPAVQVPSAIVLSSFYHCDILDLLESLSLLREYRYDYLMKSLDLPIVLVDPLSRLRRSRATLRKTASAIRQQRQGRPVFPNYPV